MNLWIKKKKFAKINLDSSPIDEEKKEEPSYYLVEILDNFFIAGFLIRLWNCEIILIIKG